MKKEPSFCWDPETGSALCVISDRNNTYYGTATCAPEDRDMMSEKTGCEIAYRRAIISALRSKRDELKSQYKGLEIYYHTINHSKYFDENSYPVRRLISHMALLKDDIDTLQEEIAISQHYLTAYLKGKAEFYKKIRENRKADSNQ